MKRKRWLSQFFLLVFLMNLIVPVQALATEKPYKQNINLAVSYLKSIQNNDGGFPWYQEDKESDHVVTAWVVMALNAAEEDVQASSWKKNGQNPIDYLVKQKDKLESTNDYARHLLALSTVNAYDEEKKQLANKIKSWQKPNGHFSQIKFDEAGFINAHMWSILALTSVREEVPNSEKAKKWLIAEQNKDGGFAWHQGLDSDLDDTAVAIQVLINLGEDPKNSTVIKRALKYIKSSQQNDGGFSSGWAGSNSNASTDSWVWQALIAADEKHDGVNWTIKKKNVSTHLIGLQDPSGYFRWMNEENKASVIDTAYAIMALSGKYMPVNIEPPEKVKPALFWLRIF
ncbi:MAG TPA: prenyltransferase/squalene oxidase repeat-containing protein [Syntrophomonadaceae bacterium]|nr:prenyltransferase/squalene oxidase repeat-containing protein [Syntrophomonadaceae bacterium]